MKKSSKASQKFLKTKPLKAEPPKAEPPKAEPPKAKPSKTGVRESAFDTPLCRLLGCRYPIVQTAMGWIATPRLVVAVSDAGGFGFLAGATMSVGALHKAVLEVKKKTDKPFGVNFHAFQHDADAIVEMVIQENIRAVSYGRAPDQGLIKQLRKAGVLCIPTVGALRHAQKAIALGADAITVQGSEGGGHTGSVATTVLLPQVLAKVSVPVIAAGGFYSGASLVAALAYGASGVAMGTRFLMTEESPIKAKTRDYYRQITPSQIVISRSLDGLPQRMILNDMLRKIQRSWKGILLIRSLWWGLTYGRKQGLRMTEFFASGWRAMRTIGLVNGMMAANAPALIMRAIVDDHVESGILPSGQVAGILQETPSCKEVITTIMTEAEQSRTRILG